MPSRTPRALRACIASLVRFLLIFRSHCASCAMMPTTSSPVGVEVSTSTSRATTAHRLGLLRQPGEVRDGGGQAVELGDYQDLGATAVATQSRAVSSPGRPLVDLPEATSSKQFPVQKSILEWARDTSLKERGELMAG